MTKRSIWSFLTVITLFGLAPALQSEQVVFSEIMYHPAGARPEFIEVQNNTATPFDIGSWRLRGGVDYDFPEFSAANPNLTFLKPFERILLTGVDESALRAAYSIPANTRIYGPWTGNLDNGGERITLKDRNGVVVCTVSYNDRGKWPVAADGTGHTLVLVDGDKPIDNWRNWSLSQRPGGTPGGEEIVEAETAVANPEINLAEGIPFVEYGDVWKFNDKNQDLGVAWRAPSYNDASWDSGPGLLGFENSALPAPGIQTPMYNGTAAENLITYYLRKEFTYNGSLQNVTITIDQIVDDGVMYYLNGQELGRVGLPGGTVTFTTLANRTVGNATEVQNVISTGGSALVNGRNVLAAELHQHSATSSDAVFGCRLKVSVPSQSNVLINEVFPAGAGSGFVEFYNPSPNPVNLRNYYLSDSAANLRKHRIATNVEVPAGGFATVGFTESGLTAGSTLTVYLTDADGVTALNAISTSVALSGRSIGRKPAGSGTWFLFADATPGAPNTSQTELAAALHLSEVHFSASNTVDWVEFYNGGEGSLALSGFDLASQADLSNRLALTGVVPAGGYASVDCNFPAPDGDVNLFLVNAANAVLVGERFQKSIIGDSLQAYPAGADEFYGAVMSSRDQANNPPRNEDIVINEIMYDPPSDEVAGEYVELFNRGGVAVDVSNWRFTEGLNFTIPPGTTIPAGGYLVVAADVDWMRSAYGTIAVVGNFSGRLSNTGDLIQLVDQWGNLVDEVDYRPGGAWPNLSNGDGTSMELRNPWMDNRLPSAWMDSNETNKTSFRHYRYADTFRQLRSDGSPTDYKELHFHLVGDSHVVLRNIQLRLNGAGGNLLQNTDRMSTDCCSASGWLAQGTHYASHLENGELHIIADGHGDNRPNRVEIDATAMNSGQNYEVSFDARWVAGASRLVVQTWDHSIATSIPLEVPKNLGTPGAQNSQFIASPAAQVDDLLHHPPVPAGGEPVRVTARITSATPGPQVRLYHRLDNINGDGAWQNKPMFDDGFSGGDEVAGDGVYTATLTEYGSSGNVVQFYVRATAGGQSTQMPKWGEARPAMYVVDNPSSVGDLRRMRFVVSALDLDALNDRDNPTGSYGYKFPRLSNHYYNMTLIINEQNVVYNCEVRNSGSPWTRGNNLSRGKYKFPKDHLFRGKEKFQFDNDAGGGSRHHNRIVRYWLYLLGHPVNENEYVQVEVNNGGSGLKEEVEPLGNDLLNRNFENGSQGELYRIDDEWWFKDDWGRSSRNADWGYKGTDNAGRYRTEWMKRSRENEDDFSALIAFFKKISQGYTQAEIERLIDPEAAMKLAAVRGYIYDWDSFSLNRGKNGYFYRRPTDGRFMFMHWDSDLAFRSGDISKAFYNGMTGYKPYIQKSYNMRRFKHYLAELVENYTQNSPRMDAWLQAEENASSQYTVSGTYKNTWFPGREGPALSFLGSALNTTFNITSNSGNPITTGGASVNLSGVAPLRVFAVEVAGHPEAQFAWSGDTSWTLTGILLRSGLNALAVNAVDEFGRIVHTDTITVTKTGNALPVMALDADPKSWRVSVIKPLELDARGSYDPDHTALTFSWAVSPADAQLETSQQDRATAVFPRPGLYSISVTGRDANGGATTMQREAAVYAPDGFSPFNDAVLEPYWNLANVERRQNYTVGAYYSLSEVNGHLVMQALDDTARPLTTPAPRYPYIWRALPAQTDWAFMTKVGLLGQVFGDYISGLLVEVSENGVPVRYAFGIENGSQLNVRRITASGAASTLRSAPLSENEVTLRIRRNGNTLHFEQLVDEAWISLHSSGLTTGTTALKGGLFLATDAAQLIRCAFDFALLVDPSATSDLRESLRISEIMYNPEGGSDYEYLELVNIGEATLDLSGVHFTAGINYAFANATLGPRQYIVVAKNPAAFAARYSTLGVNLAPGAYSGRLDNAGETLELSDAQGIVILSVTYGVSSPWPADANGGGSSLEAVDPNANQNDAGNWRASPEPNGSPGRAGGALLGTVIVNEVLTHTDPPFEDAIELFNRTDTTIDISGWYLSDSKLEPKRFRIPNGTVLGPGAYTVFYELEFRTNNTLVPFSLSSVHGDQVYLSAADAQGNLTGYQSRVDFDAAANGVSFGRYESSAGREFTAMSERTFGADMPATVAEFRAGTGAANSAPRVGPVVINEIMYHPPDIGGTNDNALDEFVELHNITTNTVLLYDPAFATNTWRLRGGADFDFPTGVSIPARGYVLVVGFDPATNATQLTAFRATYGLPANVPIHGPWSGKLQNSSESVKLLRPDAPQDSGPDAGVVPYILVDLVRYADAYPWPESPDGAGDSLQRRRPFAYGNDPVNWQGAAPTAGRANVPGSTFTDTDHDGLPNSFELANNLNTADPADAQADADQDGKTNEEEFLDGTAMRNALDFLRAPVITIQPADREVAAGSSASLSVTASGTAPLRYQWRHNGLPIPGATSAALILTDVQLPDAAEYQVVVYNDAGFALSQPARVTVNQPLEILSQPLSQFADIGSTVTLNVLAVGTGPLRYQWLKDFADLPGATASSLVLTDVQAADSGNYRVRITDDVTSVTSADATVTVLSPPTIVQHPQSRTEVAYSDFFFSVTAGGEGPFTYQWRFNGVNIIDATNAILELNNVQPSQAGVYSVEVSNPVASVVSQDAVLTLLIPATITQQPQSQLVDPGQTVTFTVAATSSTPITYQWRFNDIDLPGATGNSLTLSNVDDDDAGNYQVIVTDGVGAVRSEIAVLTVLSVPVIIQNPVNLSVVEGGTAVISVETTGALPMGYRWRSNFFTIGTVLLHSHKAFLTIDNVSMNADGAVFEVIITNITTELPGLAKRSQRVNLTVLPDGDQDGLPDAWETENNADDPDLDHDLDGLINLEEYQAGTDPWRAESLLQVDGLETGGSATLSFQTMSNHTYTIEYADDLQRGLWLKLDDLVAHSTNRVERIYDPHWKAQRYYRLITPRQPDPD